MYIIIIIYVHVKNPRAQELCESRGGRLGLLSLINLMVSVGVKQHEAKSQTLAAIPLFVHTEILHTLVGMGSAARAAAVPYPGKAPESPSRAHTHAHVIIHATHAPTHAHTNPHTLPQIHTIYTHIYPGKAPEAPSRTQTQTHARTCIHARPPRPYPKHTTFTHTYTPPSPPPRLHTHTHTHTHTHPHTHTHKPKTHTDTDTHTHTHTHLSLIHI